MRNTRIRSFVLAIGAVSVAIHAQETTATLVGNISDTTSATKAVHFKESRTFEFRAEFFNLLKHYNPDPQTVDTNINSATFGSIGGGVQGISTRVIQLGAKLYF